MYHKQHIYGRENFLQMMSPLKVRVHFRVRSFCNSLYGLINLSVTTARFVTLLRRQVTDRPVAPRTRRATSLCESDRHLAPVRDSCLRARYCWVVTCVGAVMEPRRGAILSHKEKQYTVGSKSVPIMYSFDLKDNVGTEEIRTYSQR